MSFLLRKATALILITLSLVAASQLAGAALIYGKAWLAPILIERAYRQTPVEGAPVKPWPWADTYPVARLSLPRLSLQRVVLEGDSGNALAFGPGMAAGVRPGDEGMVMVSAHRDTHFRFLQEITGGDAVHLDYRGSRFRYRVRETLIADARDGRLHTALPEQGLLLVTCYPFDAVIPGGPLRFVVIAERQRPADAGGTTSL